jgi:hypothetical protein
MVVLAVLSLLPAQDMVRIGIPGQLEHFVAYAGSATIAIPGYGRRGAVRIIGLFWIYAGILESSSIFRRLRHPSVADFAGIGARSVLWRARRSLLARRLWKGACSDVA